MKIKKTSIEGAFVIEPEVFSDERGFFMETWNKKNFSKIIGSNFDFVQDNYSFSYKNILRGLHYQLDNPQGKLVRVSHGSVIDVAVDLRKSSATFGKYESIILSGENRKQFWIPEGCAHGFLVLSETTSFLYKTTDCYVPGDEYTIRFDDKDLKIDWTVAHNKIILSEKDRKGLSFKEAPSFE
ncbi:dTDP-4-dehydrorhamnose 3,5-epimerase [Gammaproteobacteria bacterium]|nr:dTDP-4-dehydrorhamnose 3,5-epimerase [Gammaproteobacteria bacterium]